MFLMEKVEGTWPVLTPSVLAMTTPHSSFKLVDAMLSLPLPRDKFNITSTTSSEGGDHLQLSPTGRFSSKSP